MLSATCSPHTVATVTVSVPDEPGEGAGFGGIVTVSVAPASIELIVWLPEKSPESVTSLVRFALSEVGRRLRERNLFFFHPADSFQGVLRETLEARRGGEMGAEVVVVAEPPSPVLGDSDVAWVPPGRMPGCPPFLLHFGDGPSYALVCGHKPEQDGVRLFHTSERALVEYLAFRLQKELNVPSLA